MFCEASADHRTVAGIVDRVLAERCDVWVREQLDAHPEGVRTWFPDERGEPWSDVHSVRNVALALGLRLQHGHFDGKPAEPYAHMVFNAVLVSRANAATGSPIDALVVVADLDNQPAERLRGLEQGRARGQAVLDTVPVLVGAPNPNREAWVLVGFEPLDAVEKAKLDAERQTLGFFPNVSPERLTAMDEHAKNHTKRVVDALTDGDAEREARCWSETPVALLEARGNGCGLSAFMAEVERKLCAQVDGRTRP